MIRITRETDYGLVLLAQMGAEAPGRLLSARDLAERTGLSLPMVSKILKMLVRGGLLVSERGVKGGYGLAGPLDGVSLGRVIQALEGPIGMTECTTTPGRCELEPGCPARFNWHRVSEAVQQVLERIPLTEMIGSRPSSLLQLR